MHINQSFLDEFITKYKDFVLKYASDIEAREARNNALLSEFLSRYSLEKFKKLKINEYCFEKGNRNNFCYWLDNTLNDMCNIHIDNAAGFQKFHIQKIKGIYKFKRKNQKRCWAGNNSKQVFSNVKKEIVELIKEAKSGEDIQKIENNHISTN